ncbi:All-trans-retinol 13,14-reductase [Spironucleus salmonicida]|uniref:All-trans-retinol 13,14-reductase n=1 Tax=Spironucleus salmonicida TaxID=348837 RepID=V6LME8_9EUKA|nr:All-trans-retinol 13,14-reductase [Spironucleus salmonicida]KAH0569280.1 All-trans-retinol 13,14-reductase [Spironucleus salmonicida]KAH0569282.1 All-trans-retinol 13,14-reductase [Spironucleus salmonicida]KAH0569751.1 All-trans-retinol 13,14-reductase [Spironucleus salmonicida]KAH0574602.1 All-trans-retinol 13,14-reductase [Spironucleus salmonicida]|eukprot:EST44881.1 Caretonoid isomerase [Spironucleus salmonicida]
MTSELGILYSPTESSLQNKFDHIIIGSGLGGLICAAKLALNGKKVIVLEQHFQAGGCATTFKRGKDVYEVALHEMDLGDKKTDGKHRIFKELGIDKNITFVSSNSVWDIADKENHYSIPHGLDNARNYLIEKFPHEEKGIRRYFKKIYNTARCATTLPYNMGYFQFFFFPIVHSVHFTWPMIRKHTIGQWLDFYITDEKLKNVINTNIVYYSDNPYNMNLIYHAIPQCCYYQKAVQIQGGSGTLSNYLVSVIREHGGEVRLMADVTKIILQDEHAKKPICTGVSYFDRKTKTQVNVNLTKISKSNKIVCNCAPDLVFGRMIPKLKNTFDERSKRKAPAVSLFVIYFVCNADLNTLFPNNAYSTFFSNDLSRPLSDLNLVAYEKIEERSFVFVDHSKVDSRLTASGRTFCNITTAAYIQEWKDLTPDAYKLKKQEVADIYINRLEEYYPGIKAVIDHIEVGTPNTMRRYTRSESGSLYGYNPDEFGSQHRMKNFHPMYKNLCFSSAWSFPGGGFTGAIICGDMTATKILDQHILLKKIIFTVFCALVIAAVCTTLIEIPRIIEAVK